MNDGRELQIYEISMLIRPGMPVYPGDPQVKFEPVCTISRDGFNLAQITFGTHTGTHIDAPRHFKNDGAPIDSIPLERFISPCKVVEIEDPEAVRPNEVANLDLRQGESVLFKTHNSSRLPLEQEFDPEYVYITPEAARILAERKLNLVGIDALSVEAFASEGFETHEILLNAGVMILEGIQLQAVEPGEYELICFPLRLMGLDASPVRAVLVKR